MGGNALFTNSEFRGGKFVDSRRNKPSANTACFYMGSKFFDGLWDCKSEQWNVNAKWYDGYIIMDDVNEGKKFQSYISPKQIEKARYILDDSVRQYLKNEKVKYTVDLRFTKDDLKNPKGAGNIYIKDFNKLQSVKS